MKDRIKISEDVTVGAQPSEEQIAALRDEGFKTIINFRTAGEEDQPFSPTEEGEKVKQLGLNYVHIPVSMDGMETEVVDRFRRQYREQPKPVFAHCKVGKRAGAMVMMHMASEQGMSGEEALKQAESMGFECEKQELIDFVKEYVDSHGK